MCDALCIDPQGLADAIDRMVRAADPQAWSEPIAPSAVDVGQAEATATLGKLARLIGSVPAAFYDQLSVVAVAADRGARDAIAADTPVVDLGRMPEPATGSATGGLLTVTPAHQESPR